MLNSSLLVSVITCFFNEERFLAEAVESVIMQDYTNWELILVDDGSSDESTRIAKEYAASHPGKIIYAEHPAHSNRGLSASRNHGIAASSGELVAFLDADDVWRPAKLQVQAGIMMANPGAGMLCEASEYWYSWFHKSRIDVVIKVGNEKDGVVDPPHLAEMLYPLAEGAAPCPSGIMVRMDVLQRHGGFEAHFTGKYQLYEDQGFLHKIYLNEPVYVSSLCHNRYRQREGSLVEKVTTDGGYYAVRKYFLLWLQRYMEENAIGYPSVKLLLQKALAPIVTVLMPVYNAEKYLREAIDSILDQTLPDFIFLIIDDGSTDSSAAIVQSYSDNRIRFIQNERNSGISATLNQGIEMCTTELIARMDADDISYPSRLQKQCDFFRANPDCALLSTAARNVTASKENVKTDKFRSEFYYYNLTFECWIYHPTVMYKRQAVIDSGRYSTPYSEDYELWWHLSRKYRINHLEQVLLDYRVTDESLCRVTRKTEYELAQYSQVKRNIHYFTGDTFTLTYPETECLRHNFQPLLELNSVTAIHRCIKKLNEINRCIINRKNINADTNIIREAAYFKKQFIMDFFFTHLSPPKAASLALRTGSWRHRYNRRFKQIVKRVHSLTSLLRNSGPARR
jgi:glycosyltransferase involved in cell wall biosynthesis